MRQTLCIQKQLSQKGLWKKNADNWLPTSLKTKDDFIEFDPVYNSQKTTNQQDDHEYYNYYFYITNLLYRSNIWEFTQWYSWLLFFQKRQSINFQVVTDNQPTYPKIRPSSSRYFNIFLKVFPFLIIYMPRPGILSYLNVFEDSQYMILPARS